MNQYPYGGSQFTDPHTMTREEYYSSEDDKKERIWDHNYRSSATQSNPSRTVKELEWVE